MNHIAYTDQELNILKDRINEIRLSDSDKYKNISQVRQFLENNIKLFKPFGLNIVNEPIECMPLNIHNSFEPFSVIAKWRLEIGK